MDLPDRMNESWKIQNEVSVLGFDWPGIEGVLAKVKEEVGEIEEALLRDDEAQAREELGDLFFAVVNLARFLDVHPSDAMHSANEKFRRRFAIVEEIVLSRKIEMRRCSLEELDAIWDEVKRSEQGGKK